MQGRVEEIRVSVFVSLFVFQGYSTCPGQWQRAFKGQVERKLWPVEGQLRQP